MNQSRRTGWPVFWCWGECLACDGLCYTALSPETGRRHGMQMRKEMIGAILRESRNQSTGSNCACAQMGDIVSNTVLSSSLAKCREKQSVRNTNAFWCEVNSFSEFQHLFTWVLLDWSSIINPLTAPARKFSWLKSAHIHTCKQHIWWAYNKSIFSTVDFGYKSFHVLVRRRGKALMISNVALLLVVFRVTVRQVRQWKG